jgi:hypothetical protein
MVVHHHCCSLATRAPTLCTLTQRVVSSRALCTDAQNELSDEALSVGSGSETSRRNSTSSSCGVRTPSYVCAATCARKCTPTPLASGRLPRVLSAAHTAHAGTSAQPRQRLSCSDRHPCAARRCTGELVSSRRGWRASWGNRKGALLMGRISTRFRLVWTRRARRTQAGRTGRGSGTGGRSGRHRCWAKLLRGGRGRWRSRRLSF